MKAWKICLFGNFGSQNLGNECTLEAVVDNLRERVPELSLECICADPRSVSASYGIRASSMYARRRDAPRSRNALARLLRRVFVRLPGEGLHWIAAIRSLKRAKLLVMTGTGMLSDFGIVPFDVHYQILKWTVAAKLRGTRVVFLSVGSSPLEHPLSRWLVKAALSLADYRSCRDEFSRDCLQRIGADARLDGVYPDLAFSLPRRKLPDARTGDRSGRVVAIGLMDYYGKASRPETGEQIYRSYLRTMTRFTGWLLTQGHTVRLLIGDVSYDRRAKQDLIAGLRADGVTYDESRLVDEPVSSVEELLRQLGGADLVVATRFHNVALALLLVKPVVAIAYDPKIDALMAGLGVGQYSLPIDSIDVDTLVDAFRRLDADAEAVKNGLARGVEQHRQALDRQYTAVLQMIERAPGPTAARVSRSEERSAARGA